MRHFSSLLICLAACALLMLGWPVLVQGPEGDVPAESAGQIPQCAVIACIATADADAALPATSTSRANPLGLTDRTEDETVFTPVIAFDRNGQPMTSRVWWRTVYTACPPEGLPG